MEKTEAYKLCEEFAEKIKALFQTKARQEVQLYNSDIVKNIVVDETRENYEEILTYIKKIENVINYTMEA